MKKGPLLTRFYDDAISAPLLKQIVERRASPTGIEHKVPVVMRGSEDVFQYPYAQMELGDFFIVPTRGRSEKSMRTAFKQAAARYDYELVVAPWPMKNGDPGLRVCLTAIGIVKFKVKWEKDSGKQVTVSDGRWKGRRRANRKTKQNTVQVRPDNTNNPFWADADPEIPSIDPLPAIVAEVPMDKFAARRRALILSGMSEAEADAAVKRLASS